MQSYVAAHWECLGARAFGWISTHLLLRLCAYGSLAGDPSFVQIRITPQKAPPPPAY